MHSVVYLEGIGLTNCKLGVSAYVVTNANCVVCMVLLSGKPLFSTPLVILARYRDSVILRRLVLPLCQGWLKRFNALAIFVEDLTCISVKETEFRVNNIYVQPNFSIFKLPPISANAPSHLDYHFRVLCKMGCLSNCSCANTNRCAFPCSVT